MEGSSHTYTFGAKSWILPLTGERKPYPFPASVSGIGGLSFSPDGHWAAYVSQDSLRNEVFIAPFPGPGGRVQVSTSGGTEPRWRGDGRDLYYISPDGHLMAAELTAKGGALEVGRVEALFGGNTLGFYDVSRDGQHFLVVVPVRQTGPEPLTLVQNWAEGFKK